MKKYTDIEIINNFNIHKNIRICSNDLGICQETIRKTLVRNDIPRLGHTCDLLKNDRYFQHIDSEDKAYFLGFILADGNISKTSNRVSIQLNIKDKYILEKFKHCINSSNSIRDYKVFDKRKNKFNEITVFQVSSKNIISDLKDNGIDFNKSKYFYYTKISQNKYFNHFLRGVFDGDGSISNNNIQLISTFEFLEYINVKYLSNKYNFIQINKNLNIYRLYIYDKSTKIDLLNFIYKDSTIYLKRKYDLYQDVINYKIYNTYRVRPCTLIDINNNNIYFNSVSDVAIFLKTKVSTLINSLSKHGHYKNNVIIRHDYINIKKEIFNVSNFKINHNE